MQTPITSYFQSSGSTLGGAGTVSARHARIGSAAHAGIGSAGRAEIGSAGRAEIGSAGHASGLEEY